MAEEKTTNGETDVHPLLRKPGRYQRPRRKDRSHYILESAMDEIELAEQLLDTLGAPKGLTMWGRIRGLAETHSLKEKHE